MAKLPNFLIMASPFSFKSNDIGMKLITAQHRRELPDIKTLNYAFPIRMLPDMRRVGADDLLYYDTDGQVSELSRSNVFIVKNGCIATPKDGVLYGITRKKTLEIARQHFSVEERPVTLAEVLDADEVFTTGSTKRITYIAQIDHQEYTLGDITRNLQQLLVEAEK